MKRYGMTLAILAFLALFVTSQAFGQCSGCSSSKTAMDPKPAVKPADLVDTAVGAGSFKTLVAAVNAAGLVDTLKGKGPFTVFAPTDEAFDKLPEGTVKSLLEPKNREKLVAILTYHVIPGRWSASDVVSNKYGTTVNGASFTIRSDKKGVSIDNARVLKTDILASNGIIHVIDSVILPPERPDIVDTARKAGAFGTLLAAVKAAGLCDVLRGDGPFTVFAPTDEAFAKLPKGTVETLLRPENRERLQSILTYHVVPGKVLSSEAIKMRSAATVNGKKFSIMVRDGSVLVDRSKVVKADIGGGGGGGDEERHHPCDRYGNASSVTSPFLSPFHHRPGPPWGGPGFLVDILLLAFKK